MSNNNYIYNINFSNVNLKSSIIECIIIQPNKNEGSERVKTKMYTRLV